MDSGLCIYITNHFDINGTDVFLVNQHIEGILVVIRRRWMLLCFHLLQAVVMPEKIEELNSI